MVDDFLADKTDNVLRTQLFFQAIITSSYLAILTIIRLRPNLGLLTFVIGLWFLFHMTLPDYFINSQA